MFYIGKDLFILCRRDLPNFLFLILDWNKKRAHQRNDWFWLSDLRLAWLWLPKIEINETLLVETWVLPADLYTLACINYSSPAPRHSSVLIWNVWVSGWRTPWMNGFVFLSLSPTPIPCCSPSSRHANSRVSTQLFRRFSPEFCSTVWSRQSAIIERQLTALH